MAADYRQVATKRFADDCNEEVFVRCTANWRPLTVAKVCRHKQTAMCGSRQLPPEPGAGADAAMPLPAFLCVFLCDEVPADGSMVFAPDAPDTVSVEPPAFGLLIPVPPCPPAAPPPPAPCAQTLPEKTISSAEIKIPAVERRMFVSSTAKRPVAPEGARPHRVRAIGMPLRGLPQARIIPGLLGHSYSHTSARADSVAAFSLLVYTCPDAPGPGVRGTLRRNARASLSWSPLF